jgi:hypothetical protein
MGATTACIISEISDGNSVVVNTRKFLHNLFPPGMRQPLTFGKFGRQCAPIAASRFVLTLALPAGYAALAAVYFVLGFISAAMLLLATIRIEVSAQ